MATTLETAKANHATKTTVCAGCGAVFKNLSALANHGQYNKECTPEMRFWGRVNKNTPSGCWIWTGCVDKWGYGDLNVRGKHIQAHRYAWMLLNGDPGELDVLHKCNTQPCCNPGHLYLGTDLENARDRVAAGTARTATKLTPEAVAEIRRLAAERVPHKEIAEKFGITASYVSHIKCGVVWQDGVNP